MHSSTATAAGVLLGQMRRARRLSQLELSLRVGVSQRHLSFIETGRGRASRAMLHALLEALDAPLGERNETLLAAGFAPVFGARPLDDPAMALVRDTLSRLLAAHEPAPALVLDPEWNLLLANQGARALFALLGCELTADAGLGRAADSHVLNMLEATFAAGGLCDSLLNAEEVCPVLWHSAVREAACNAGLRARLHRLSPQVPAALKGAASTTRTPPPPSTPVMISRFRSPAAELAFFSTYTSFGSPLDVTAASLRVEHLFPADERTRGVLARCIGNGAEGRR